LHHLPREPRGPRPERSAWASSRGFCDSSPGIRSGLSGAASDVASSAFSRSSDASSRRVARSASSCGLRILGPRWPPPVGPRGGSPGRRLPCAWAQSSSFSSASFRRAGADPGSSSLPSAARQGSSPASCPASPSRGSGASRRRVNGSPGGSRPPAGCPDSGALDTESGASSSCARLRSPILHLPLPSKLGSLAKVRNESLGGDGTNR
jgi:hypothetical protein